MFRLSLQVPPRADPLLAACEYSSPAAGCEQLTVRLAIHRTVIYMPRGVQLWFGEYDSLGRVTVTIGEIRPDDVSPETALQRYASHTALKALEECRRGQRPFHSQLEIPLPQVEQIYRAWKDLLTSAGARLSPASL